MNTVRIKLRGVTTNTHDEEPPPRHAAKLLTQAYVSLTPFPSYLDYSPPDDFFQILACALYSPADDSLREIAYALSERDFATGLAAVADESNN